MKLAHSYRKTLPAHCTLRVYHQIELPYDMVLRSDSGWQRKHWQQLSMIWDFQLKLQFLCMS